MSSALSKAVPNTKCNVTTEVKKTLGKEKGVSVKFAEAITDSLRLLIDAEHQVVSDACYVNDLAADSATDLIVLESENEEQRNIL